MGTTAFMNTSSLLREYELPSHPSPITRSPQAATAKFMQNRSVSGKVNFPPSNRVAVDGTCKVRLKDDYTSLGDPDFRYRACVVTKSRKSMGKDFFRGFALPQGAESSSIEMEGSSLTKELSLGDEKEPRSTASGADMEDHKELGEQVGRELLSRDIGEEGFDTSTTEISDSSAMAEEAEVLATCLRAHSNPDDPGEGPTPTTRTSSSNSEQESSSNNSPSSTRRIDASSEEEVWHVLTGDATSVAPVLPYAQRHTPNKLLQLLLRYLEIPDSASPQAALEQVRNSLMFWKSWGRTQEEVEADERVAPLLAASAFEKRTGVSELHQWTATELSLQYKLMRRITRDVTYLMIACWWVGMVRVAEAVVATFRKSPPVYSKLWEATNSLDMFTIAWLAYSLRKALVAVLQVDPINVQEVADIKANIWDHMHKFYERQWKVVATLAMGKMLALIASSLPSTSSITDKVKMCWDMFLALPVF